MIEKSNLNYKEGQKYYNSEVSVDCGCLAGDQPSKV